MSVVSLAPVVQVLQPLLIAAISGLVTGFVGWAALLLHKYLGIVLTQKEMTAIERAVTTQAGKWVAGAEPGWASKSITVENPFVAFGANEVMKDLPNEVVANGITPDKIRSLIVGKIGEMQAQGVSTVSIAHPEEKK